MHTSWQVCKLRTELSENVAAPTDDRFCQSELCTQPWILQVLHSKNRRQHATAENRSTQFNKGSANVPETVQRERETHRVALRCLVVLLAAGLGVRAGAAAGLAVTSVRRGVCRGLSLLAVSAGVGSGRRLGAARIGLSLAGSFGGGAVCEQLASVAVTVAAGGLRLAAAADSVALLVVVGLTHLRRGTSAQFATCMHLAAFSLHIPGYVHDHKQPSGWDQWQDGRMIWTHLQRIAIPVTLWPLASHLN